MKCGDLGGVAVDRAAERNCGKTACGAGGWPCHAAPGCRMVVAMPGCSATTSWRPSSCAHERRNLGVALSGVSTSANTQVVNAAGSGQLGSR